jgi:hypothetical protein
LIYARPQANDIFDTLAAAMATPHLPARNKKRDGHARTDFAILLRSVSGLAFPCMAPHHNKIH